MTTEHDGSMTEAELDAVAGGVTTEQLEAYATASRNDPNDQQALIAYQKAMQEYAKSLELTSNVQRTFPMP